MLHLAESLSGEIQCLDRWTLTCLALTEQHRGVQRRLPPYMAVSLRDIEDIKFLLRKDMDLLVKDASGKIPSRGDCLILHS